MRSSTVINLNSFHLLVTGSCKKRTTSNYCCIFPFIYKGRRYNSCTTKNSKRPWCAKTPNYDRDKKWGYCTSMLLTLSLYKNLFIRILRLKLAKWGVFTCKFSFQLKGTVTLLWHHCHAIVASLSRYVASRSRYCSITITLL